MSQDTNVENLIINKLTKAQYESIATPDPTQLYFITDEVISSSDVVNALGYTPENVSNKVTSISSSSTDTQYPSAKLVYDQLAGKQPTLVSGTNIKTINSTSLLGSGNIAVQPTITSSAMLSSDLVDDTNHTHKFATATQLSQIATNATNITTINGKIPAEATTTNQLADKAFVNSSVQTATANFRGNWGTWASVPTSASSYPADYAGSTTPTVNDYLVVQDASDYTGDTLEGTWRFKYSGTWATDGKNGWLPEYQVNETPLTAAQLAALNSGITSSDVALIGTALQPNDNVSELSNDAGYITEITSSDVTTALGFTPYDSSNPAGYTSNVGTVTSVNNISPVNGNVTLSIPDTSNLANKDLSNLSTTGNSKFQAPLVSGTNIKTVNNNSLLGSGNINIDSLPSQTGQSGKFLTTNGTTASWATVTAPDIDNTTITQNADDELQTVAVIDNNSGNAIKTWTGTKAEYDAIATKDSNTLYNITDDTDTTLTLLELLFPVGAVYFGTMSTCPLQTLGVGTWQALPSDKVIQIAGTRGAVNTTINESLPNHIHTEQFPFSEGTRTLSSRINSSQGSGVIKSLTSSLAHVSDGDDTSIATKTEGVYDNSTYQDNAPVQQDAYLLNGWRRIA